MKLSDKIRIIRKARGFSQEGLGNSLSRVNQYGISRQTVSDWENGNTEPKLENIRDLAEVLNVSFDALLDESIDLNDQDVLNRVLKNTSKTVKQSVNASFTYSIYAHKFFRESLKKILITGIIGLLGVPAGIVGFILLITTKGTIQFWIILMLMFGIVALPFFVSFFTNLVYALRHKRGALIGTINESYLIIHTFGETSNTLYIPVEKIISMELSGKKKKNYDDVVVQISNRARPVTILNVDDPQKLIKIFKSIGSYIENPDGIKVL